MYQISAHILPESFDFMRLPLVPAANGSQRYKEETCEILANKTPSNRK